jgi:protein transport protein SEC31
MPKSDVNGTQAGGEDFFDQRQYVSEGGFELKQAPKWLQVPCSASFGFGGALVSVKNIKGKGEIKLNKYISEPKISENASEFEKAIQTADWSAYCEKQVEKATDNERDNWELLKLLFDSQPRQKLIKYLGVTDVEVDGLSEKVNAVKLGKTDSEVTATEDSDVLTAPAKSNRLSGIFGSEAKTDDPFSHLSPTVSRSYSKDPFSISSSSDSESDKTITQAILFGHFDKAVDICLNEDRLDDAFVLATQGNAAIQKKVQDAYFSRNIQRSSYLRLLQSVIDSNLWDVAEHAELTGWKETLVTFCTFAKTDDEFSRLCEILGQRLEEETKVEDAKVCYLAGKKLDRVVNIWIAEADAQEQEELRSSQSDSAFSIHARALQGFVEKVTVFKQATDTKGGDLKPLYEKYTEFVDIVASQGNLSVAQKYIELLPGENEAVKTVKDRLAKAIATAPAPAPAPAKVAHRGPEPARRQPPMSTGFPPSQYAPAQPNVFAPSAPYTPLPAPAPAPAPPAVSASPYNPVGPQYPSSQFTQNPYGGYMPHQPTNPAISRISDLPPPPPKKTSENWNDPPMLTNPVRTRTPVAPMAKPPSPYTGPSPASSPALTKQPVGPPPTSAKPPQRIKSPPISSPQMGQAFPPLTATPQIPSQPPPSGPPMGLSRPPTNTFTPPPPQHGTPQPPPPPTGQYRPPNSISQTRPQYAPSPMQQNNVAPPPASFPPQGQKSQYAPPPATRNQYTPAASPPPEAPSAPPVKATPPPTKFRIPLIYPI